MLPFVNQHLLNLIIKAPNLSAQTYSFLTRASAGSHLLFFCPGWTFAVFPAGSDVVLLPAGLDIVLFLAGLDIVLFVCAFDFTLFFIAG